MELVALAAVIGGLALELLVVPTGESAPAAVRRRLLRWITGSLAVLLLVTLIDLVVRTQAMSRVPFTVAFSSVPEVLTGTHFGAIWIARSLALVLALLLSLSHAAALRWLCALATLGVALTTSLTGHAAEWGDLTVSVVADWVHAVAASAWAGGLVGLLLVLPHRGPPWPAPVLGAIARRFSRLAGLCVLAVILTGGYNAWSQLGAASALWTTAYGGLLMLKLLGVGLLVCVGALNRYVVVPSLDPSGAVRGIAARMARVSRLVLVGRARLARAAAPSRFTAYLAAEVFLALGVFTCTAVLGETTPGRHALIQRKLTTHVSAKDLRQSRDAQRGGSVTPPLGVATRGRAVFTRLQCFTCHAVRQERFPAPSRPGPDLTDVARRQSGYLVESIMNPDAMIVDGPGYTDESGRSRMPDYREQLTLSELIDLVAYLKSLDDRR